MEKLQKIVTISYEQVRESEKIISDVNFSNELVVMKVEKLRQMATILYDNVRMKLEKITGDSNY